MIGDKESSGDLVLRHPVICPVSLQPPEFSIATGGDSGSWAWRAMARRSPREFILSRGKNSRLLHVLYPLSRTFSLHLILASFCSFFRFQIMDHFLLEALPNSHHCSFTTLQEEIGGLSAATASPSLSQHYPTLTVVFPTGILTS